MLRVAHVLNSPGRGGVPRVAHALVQHCDPGEVASHVFYLKAGAETGPGEDLFDDMDIPRRVAATSSKASAMTELVAFLEQHRIDILHCHSFRPNLYARMAGAVLKPTGLRIVAHYHNDYSDKWSADVLLLEQRLANLTDAGVAVSASVAEQVAARVGLACEVVHNGIDPARVCGGSREIGRASFGFSPDHIVIGLVGRICRQKGVDSFVEAARRVARRLPTARFVIVGDGEDAALTASLEQGIARDRLTDRIRFSGHRSDMATVYAALDLLVAPSRWEGFGLVLVEAMAAGVPVLACRVGGIPAVVGDAAELVATADNDALSDRMLALATCPERRAALAAAGRCQAARFDWRVAADQTTALYRRLGKRT